VIEPKTVIVGEEETDVDEERLFVELWDTEGDVVKAPVALVTGVTVLNTVVDIEGEGEALIVDDGEPVTLSVGEMLRVTLEEDVLEIELEGQAEALIDEDKELLTVVVFDTDIDPDTLADLLADAEAETTLAVAQALPIEL